MKRILTVLGMLCFITTSSFAINSGNWKMKVNQEQDFATITENLPQNLVLEEFMDLTPSKYKELTGERLGLKKSLKLKAAQKFVKREMRKDGGDISSGLYVLLAILGLGWVAMGIMDDWDGSNWITNLILAVLCWLPGVIHALVKKNEYY